MATPQTNPQGHHSTEVLLSVGGEGDGEGQQAGGEGTRSCDGLKPTPPSNDAVQQRQHHKLLVVKGLRFAPVVLPLWRRGTPAEVSGDTNVASTASCELPYNGKPLATSALRVSAWKLRGSGRGLGRWWQKFFFAYKNLFGHGISKCKRFLLSRESAVSGRMDP